jgi:hypothetical protein
MEARTYAKNWSASGARGGRLATLRRGLGVWACGIFNDETLVLRARAGERVAFDALIARYRERIYSMAMASLGNRDEAAAALEEGMIAAFRDLRSTRANCAPSTWLHLHAFRAVLRRMNVPPGVYTFESCVTGDPWRKMPELRRNRPNLVPAPAYDAAPASARVSRRIGGARQRPLGRDD